MSPVAITQHDVAIAVLDHERLADLLGGELPDVALASGGGSGLAGHIPGDQQVVGHDVQGTVGQPDTGRDGADA